MTVAAEMQNAPGRQQREQTVKHAGHGAGVTAMRRSRRAAAPPAFLYLGAPSAAGMRGRLHTIDKPGVGFHREGDPGGQVLGEFEGLEVVEDQRLLELTAHGHQGPIQEEHGVAPEPGREAGHR